MTDADCQKNVIGLNLNLIFFSLTSLRKYQRINNIVIHHPTTKGSGQAAKKAAAAGKKTPAAKAKTQQQQHSVIIEVIGSFIGGKDGGSSS